MLLPLSLAVSSVSSGSQLIPGGSTVRRSNVQKSAAAASVSGSVSSSSGTGTVLSGGTSSSSYRSAAVQSQPSAMMESVSNRLANKKVNVVSQVGTTSVRRGASSSSVSNRSAAQSVSGATTGWPVIAAICIKWSIKRFAA